MRWRSPVRGDSTAPVKLAGRWRQSPVLCCAARFLEGDPITMTAADVISVCRAAPPAKVIAVHMEAINHCLLTRQELAAAVQQADVTAQVAIPSDGQWLG